jgi:hypothetical protein
VLGPPARGRPAEALAGANLTGAGSRRGVGISVGVCNVGRSWSKLDVTVGEIREGPAMESCGEVS